MLILAIESSCDETAASVIKKQGGKLTILSNVVSSQISLHQKYGGVVPEVAAREHIVNILPVIQEALAVANISPLTASKKLSAIAVTKGPGLITSLMVGVETAKSLSLAWQLPLIPVNHIEGHIYANWLANTPIEFPAVVMTVSGGHNMLILMTDHFKYKLIGDTRDDAAGEAFDKAAKILGLGYPGGPIIGTTALQASDHYSDIALPRPMLHSPDFDFSFSGLKTALLYKIKADKHWRDRLADYAAEFQQAVVDTLVSKTLKAATKYKAKTIMLCGGVSANHHLRQTLADTVTKKSSAKLIIAPLEYTTDNAAMIASAAAFRYELGRYKINSKLSADPNWELK